MGTHNSFKQWYETTHEKYYQPGKLTWALVPRDVRECQFCWLTISAIQTSNPIPKANQMFSINHTVSTTHLIKLKDQVIGHKKTPLSGRIFQELRAHLPRTSQRLILMTALSWECAGFEQSMPVELTLFLMLGRKSHFRNSFTII